MKLKIIILLSLLHITLVSCDKEYPSAEQKLVIEGWIENGEFPVVLVSLSGSKANDGDMISDFMVRWAKVSINDGDSTYILTGAMDDNYTPPFSYKSYDLRGKCGKTYTLKVEYNNMTATAITKIPESVKIDSVTVCNITDNDSLRLISVHFTNPYHNESFYRLRYRNFNNENRFYPSFLGTFKVSSEQNVKQPLYRTKIKTIENDYIPYFHIGSKLEIRLGHIDEESFLIWQDYDNAVNFGSSIFFQTQSSLKTNINGGYGHWIGYGISKTNIELTK